MNEDLIMKAGGLLIKDRRVLLNRQGGKGTYIVPGGQIEQGESARQALIRELEEEFRIIVSEDDLEELGTFDSPAVHHPGKIVRITLFLVKKWEGDVKVDNEIEGIAWVNTNDLNTIDLSPFATNIALPKLVELVLID